MLYIMTASCVSPVAHRHDSRNDDEFLARVCSCSLWFLILLVSNNVRANYDVNKREKDTQLS